MKLSFEQVRDAAWSALRRLLDGIYEWSVVATYEDSIVISRGPDRSTAPAGSARVKPEIMRYPFTIAANNLLTLGDPVALELVYAPLSECMGSRILGPLPVEGVETLTEAERAAKVGTQWAVVAIQSGISANRNLYSAEVLERAAKLYEGRPVFWGHTRRGANGEPDPRDTAGFLRGAQYALLEGKNGQRVGAITATLCATDRGLRERLLEAHEAGKPDLFGLSHTADCEGEYQKQADGPVLRVSRINAVESVDVVSFPSAGGRVLRLVAGLTSPVPVTEEGLMEFAQKLKKVQESRLKSALTATPTEAEVDALLRVLEAEAATQPPATTPQPAPTHAPVAAPALSDAERSLLREGIRGHRLMLIEAALIGSTLPVAMRDELRTDLLARETVTPEQITEAVKAKVAVAARVIEAHIGFGSGGGVVIEGGAEADEKSLHLLEDILMTDASDRVKASFKAITGRDPGRPDTLSVKEAYVRMTGDQRPNGRPLVREALRPMSRFDGVLAKKRLKEAIRVVEGTLLTTTWAEVFADAMGKRMLAEYRAFPGLEDWRLVAEVIPVDNFKTRKAIRWGGYGDVPVVAENANYTEATTPGDEQATWSVSKRGYTESLSWEAMVNDDLGQIRLIPVKMGRAFARTLYKFVLSDLLAANPTCDYDSTALFHANHGGNLGSTALSAAQITAAELVLANQTDMSSNEKLGLTLQWLMVPTALKETGWRLLNSGVLVQASSFNATEPNYARDGAGLSRLIVNPYLTDANNWFVGGDKANGPIIQVGFLFGQEEPTIVIADQQGVDPYFTADKIRYKGRHVYGGDVVDHRNVFGAIVA